MRSFWPPKDRIAEDCLVVLGEIVAPELPPLTKLAAEAVIALRDGHRSGAQALAGNIFDTLLRDAAGRGVIFAGPRSATLSTTRSRSGSRQFLRTR